MNLLDVVILAEDLPEEGLAAGAQGTVVHVFESPRTAYEVEFDDGRGNEVLATVLPAQICPAGP